MMRPDWFLTNSTVMPELWLKDDKAEYHEVNWLRKQALPDPETGYFDYFTLKQVPSVFARTHACMRACGRARVNVRACAHATTCVRARASALAPNRVCACMLEQGGTPPFFPVTV